MKLRNFLSRLQDPEDRQKVAANLGKNLNEVMSEQATPPIIGNQNTIEVKQMNTDTVYGYRKDKTAVTRSYAEKNLFSWWGECETFTEIGDSVYQLAQSMTSSSRMAGVCETNGDLDFEIARTKKLLAAAD